MEHTARESIGRLYDSATAIENDERLDRAVTALEGAVPQAMRDGPLHAALGGRWLGHALHPLLTDFPLGTWMSASLLDLLGGPESRPASRRLVGVGVLAAVPTALAGVTDWLSATQREQRVGVVHATLNTIALSCYTASWLARRRDRHAAGMVLGFAGGSFATLGGFLGGHLSFARDTGLRATASVLGNGERAAAQPFAAPS